MEIRVVEGKRFSVVDTAAWERLKTTAQKYGVTFSAVSPGLFKAPLSSDLLPAHLDGLLDMSLNLAERMEIDTLIVFAAQRSMEDTESDLQRVIDLLGETADRAEKQGFSVHLENIPGSWADTGDNCLACSRESAGATLGTCGIPGICTRPKNGTSVKAMNYSSPTSRTFISRTGRSLKES